MLTKFNPGERFFGNPSWSEGGRSAIFVPGSVRRWTARAARQAGRPAMPLTLFLAACGTGMPDGPLVPAQPERVPHHMVSAQRLFTGMEEIVMVLEHGSPSDQHWFPANADAIYKCREWGYAGAYVVQEDRYRILGESRRTYRCRRDASEEERRQVRRTIEEAGRPGDEAWNRALRAGRAPATAEAESLALVKVSDDHTRLFVDPRSVHFLPGEQMQLSLVLVSIHLVEDGSSPAMMDWTVLLDCDEAALKWVRWAGWDAEMNQLFDEPIDNEAEYGHEGWQLIGEDFCDGIRDALENWEANRAKSGH